METNVKIPLQEKENKTPGIFKNSGENIKLILV